MSTVTYRYENNLQQKVGGVKETLKQNIIDGEKDYLLPQDSVAIKTISVKDTNDNKYKRIKRLVMNFWL